MKLSDLQTKDRVGRATILMTPKGKDLPGAEFISQAPLRELLNRD